MKNIWLSILFLSTSFVPILFNTAYADISKPILDMHNTERESLGLEPLEWSSELETSAREWSLALTFTDKSNMSNGLGYGEIVYSGDTDTLSLTEMLETWMNGKDKFDPNKDVPENCKGNKSCMDYSQMVWSTTTHIGCGISSSMTKDVLICYYSPAGNIMDKKAY